jgi:aspartyl-tRNA synthetase
MVGDITSSLADKEVKLAGWVATRRDHGGLIFLDLRDKTGVVQLTCNPELHKEAWKVAETLRDEFVIVVSGIVHKRPSEMVNKDLGELGLVEIEVSSIKVESTSDALPFVLGDETVNEDMRLTYRFLDLRTAKMQNMLRIRAEFITEVRAFMQERGFTEVQTPILANSSPEGARDFLVPSRLHPGTFYALPQAPQQYKQLLMVGGLDKYFQIAPCFRDEDPRADRHAGDFYQIDVEMSFIEQEDVLRLGEDLMKHLSEFSGKKLKDEVFPRFTWKEAMNKFGVDKPDIRYDFFITNISEIIKDSGFKVFSEVVKNNGVVHALRAEGAAKFSRGDIDGLTELAKQHGLGGLAYIKMSNGIDSPIAKFLGDDVIKNIISETGAQEDDMIFFGAGDWLKVCKALGDVRKESAKMLGVLDAESLQNQLAWCWVIDFPMYEKDAVTGEIDFSHNPFSMPQGGMKALESENPEDILGFQYDLVVNGYEISSGAIRNHDIATLYKAFSIAGYTKEETTAKFGGMIRAFAFGAPPHGGFAPGIDRLLMVLMDVPSIRDIYAFPKNGRGQDMMMASPAKVDPKLLIDLHIKTDVEE